MKTFIRWPGNKSKYLKHIKDNIPLKYNRYIEPFVGSGALLLSIQPLKWIINDINTDLVNIWNVVKGDCDHLVTHVDKMMKEIDQLSEDKALLLTHCRITTSHLNTMKQSTQQAAILLVMKYLVFMGYLYSKNKYYFRSFDLNIYKNPVYFGPVYKENLRQVSNYLNSTQGKIYNTDYKQILRKAKQGDFVFLDPPFMEQHNYNFNYNNNQAINDLFVKDLYDEIQQLDKKGVLWMMTQADTKEIKKLFGKYNITKYPVVRVMRKDNKHPYELLIKNY
jgi:DNA adenine methylase